jgi:hypothetical protein
MHKSQSGTTVPIKTSQEEKRPDAAPALSPHQRDWLVQLALREVSNSPGFKACSLIEQADRLAARANEMFETPHYLGLAARKLK